ncbi:FAD-binding oxidoreductase [Erythrobacter sp. HL-111]|uniref:FAD-binding oxidoreductase n=1 Tax=Erythrobacter sp. HL-111 TaxID=1798193 RepID=UPI0006DACF9B|nr:FAD-binding oxidoreductase [Erythrobacter sp. HL-111]KPP95017.1 MAG: FAD/FMN-containing dehydrogenase [Erythrobacteraceae bacterium HL-111]SDS11544.1 FAD/FMN-containing dehydrogenase [Erythrobacter sp. HL-111]
MLTEENTADPAADTFLAEAADLLGARGLTRDPDLMEPWLTDWRGRYTGRALALASPGSTGEVAALVGLCARHGIAIVPQGGNSGMVGGATPDASGRSLLLSLRRMDRLRRIDPEAGQAVCEAGMILETLHELAAANGLRFPLTLGGKGSATVGGLISTNAGGTQVLRHGTMRAQVLGIEAVLANGDVYDGLTALRKDNRGFDLKQLLIGSEGTLGIVTAATLRLLPAPTARVTVWAGLPGILEARALLRALDRAMGGALEGFEVVPAHCLESVLAHLPDARAPLSQRHEWNALIEFVASDLDDAALRERAEAALGAAMADGLFEDAAIAANETQAEAFWTLRDSISAAERALGPAMQHDISVPVERMPEFILAATRQLEDEFPGTRGVAFGHLGDGNVHFHVLAPPGAAAGAWEEGEGRRVSARVHDLVTKWGGSISAEHGIGQVKLGELARLGDPVALSMMRAVKRALDPQGLLNPGKLVPLA